MKNFNKFKGVLVAVLALFMLTTTMLIIPTSANDTSQDVSVYLVLGKGGTLNGNSGNNIEEVFLTNAVLFSAPENTLLPIPERGELDFDGWAYAVDGAIVFVDKMPSKANLFVHEGDTVAILYAQWSGTASTSGGGEEPDPVVNGISFAGVTLTKGYSNVFNSDEYSGTVTLTAGQSYTISGVLNGVNGVYPSPNSGKPNAGFTMGRDGTNNIKTDDYVEAKSPSATVKSQGVNTDGDYYVEFNANAGNCYLTAKQSGTFSVYICIFDNGGWVRIFLSPQ